jgi:hypothetical protein
MWEEAAALDPGDDPALQSFHDEGVRSLQIFDGVRGCWPPLQPRPDPCRPRAYQWTLRHQTRRRPGASASSGSCSLPTVALTAREHRRTFSRGSQDRLRPVPGRITPGVLWRGVAEPSVPVARRRRESLLPPRTLAPAAWARWRCRRDRGILVGVESVYEAAGGATGMLRLAGAWHVRVMADEVVSHAFSHGFARGTPSGWRRTGARRWGDPRRTPTPSGTRHRSSASTAATGSTTTWTDERSTASTRPWTTSA